MPLVFGDPSELDIENGSESAGVMKIMSGGSGGNGSGGSGGQSGGNSGGCSGLVPDRCGGYCESGGSGTNLSWEGHGTMAVDKTYATQRRSCKVGRLQAALLPSTYNP